MLAAFGHDCTVVGFVAAPDRRGPASRLETGTDEPTLSAMNARTSASR
jgi:hypothetical protein